MGVPAVNDLKAFVPAKDYSLAMDFYQAIGFTVNWSNPQVSELELARFRFLLQNYYLQEFAENCMLSLNVPDVDAWWRHLEGLELPQKFPGARIQPPAMQAWGLKVLFMHDPSGVLWHIIEDR